MKHLLAITVITLLALGTGCAWISPSSETTSDGIQVHGHWTVTVTNPDGTLDAVHEFDNALTGYGARLLIRVLTGEWLLKPDATWWFPKEDAENSEVGSQLLYFVGAEQDRLQTNGWMIRLRSNWIAGGSQGSDSILVCDEGQTMVYGGVYDTKLLPEVGYYYTSNGYVEDNTPSDHEFILSASCRVEGYANWVATFEITEVDVLAASRHRLSPNHPAVWEIFTHHVMPSDQSIMIETGQVVGITIKISFG